MPSMQEALTDALEHPLAEPRRPIRHKRDFRKGKPQSESPSEGLWWGVLGTLVGSLLVYGLYRGLSKIAH